MKQHFFVPLSLVLAEWFDYTSPSTNSTPPHPMAIFSEAVRQWTVSPKGVTLANARSVPLPSPNLLPTHELSGERVCYVLGKLLVVGKASPRYIRHRLSVWVLAMVQ